MTPALAWDSAVAASAGGVRWAARRSGAGGETVAAALRANRDPLVSVRRKNVQPNRTV
jgi:hypothetical protein